jgi:MFS family permease
MKIELSSRHIGLIFFLFGLGIMSTASRTPEIKANLSLSNATFGAYLSFGALGSIIALSLVGEIVHKYGSKPVLFSAMTILYTTLIAIPHLHTGLYWLVVNIFLGFAASSLHISANAQAVYMQEISGRDFLARLHGLWIVGALLSATVAFIIRPFISLAWHLDILMSLAFAISMLAIVRLNPPLRGAPAESAHPRFNLVSSVTDIYRALKLHPWITFGMVTAVQFEMATSDWSTLFSKQEIKVSSTMSILPYIIFMIAMITMRLSSHRLFERAPQATWMKRLPLVGGLGFILLEQLGIHLAASHRTLGYLISILAFTSAGVGCSFLMPSFYAISTQMSSKPGSIIIAQMTFLNTVLVFIFKLVISWVAGRYSIGTAMLIPAAMLASSGLAGHLGNTETVKRA